MDFSVFAHWPVWFKVVLAIVGAIAIIIALRKTKGGFLWALAIIAWLIGLYFLLQQ